MAGQAELFGLLRSANEQLITLDLSYCGISLGMLDIISRLCPQLKKLALAYLLEKERDAVIAIFMSRCPNIEHLNTENLGIQNETLLAAVQHLKGLKSLCIRREGYFLADSSLFHIYTHCMNTLHTLYLNTAYAEGPHVLPRTINTLLEKCTSLRTFYWWNQGSEDAWFQFTPAALCNLTILIVNSDRMSEANLKTIGMSCKMLQVLAIQYVGRTWKPYSYGGLMSICRGCPALRELYINTFYQPEAQRAMVLLKASRPDVVVSYHRPNHLEYNDIYL